MSAAASSLPLQELAFVQEAVSAAAALRAANASTRRPMWPATARSASVAPGLPGALASVALVEAMGSGAFRASADLAGLGPLRPRGTISPTLSSMTNRPRAATRRTVPRRSTRRWCRDSHHGSPTPPTAPAMSWPDPACALWIFGAGAALWSRAIAARDSTCRVTAVDVPAVLQATRRAQEAARA